MTVLLHLCCAPCAIMPLAALRAQGFAVRGYFYNPNIHPFREFRQRKATVEDLAQRLTLTVEYEQEYGLIDYLRQVVFHEDKRCPLCYRMRLEATAKKALELGAEAFSTTLLYSRYQSHETILALGEELATQFGIPFYYEDFRVGWQEGIDKSLEIGLYRQPYCGCIYSEQERYDKKFRQGKKLRT